MLIETRDIEVFVRKYFKSDRPYFTFDGQMIAEGSSLYTQSSLSAIYCMIDGRETLVFTEHSLKIWRSKIKHFERVISEAQNQLQDQVTKNLAIVRTELLGVIQEEFPYPMQSQLQTWIKEQTQLSAQPQLRAELARYQAILKTVDLTPYSIVFPKDTLSIQFDIDLALCQLDFEVKDIHIQLSTHLQQSLYKTSQPSDSSSTVPSWITPATEHEEESSDWISMALASAKTFVPNEFDAAPNSTPSFHWTEENTLLDGEASHLMTINETKPHRPIQTMQDKITPEMEHVGVSLDWTSIALTPENRFALPDEFDTVPYSSPSFDWMEENTLLDEEASHLMTVNETEITDSLENHQHQLAIASVHQHVEARGGIHSKYMTEVPHPSLPKPAPHFSAYPMEHQELSFIPVHSILPSDSQHYSYSISSDYFAATLITLSKEIDTRQISTFICAGRTANALVPEPQQGRCVLICTEEEQEEIMPHLSAHLDILIISMLNSKYHGFYQELNSITARRLAAFLFASHLGLHEFIMLDDNIDKILLKKEALPISSWDNLFEHLKAHVHHKGSISVATKHNHKKAHGELGSKFFMINMRLIRELLKDEEQLFLLFPNAVQAKKWGEDYYFQLVLYYLLKERNIQGYSILPLEEISLVRSKNNRNFFASSGIKAEQFDKIDGLEPIPEELSDILSYTIIKLNQIITDNYERYAAQDIFLQNVNILNQHAIANGQNSGTSTPFLRYSNGHDNFKANFYDLINEYDFKNSILRDYQINAIKAVPQFYQYPSRFTLATGSGKSLIQSTLAIMAYHASNESQKIFIITPQIELVRQFYHDLIQYNQLLHEENSFLQIPNSAIVTVSSHLQSIGVKLLRKNNFFKSQRSIVICCEDSFKKLLEEEPSMVKTAALILLDEYHEYSLTVKQLCAALPEDGPITIASSATPPKEDIIKNTLYSFSLHDALQGDFHAPVVALPLNVTYSLSNVEMLINCLPQMLKHQYHPGFEGEEESTLAETKGIIYLESIALCENAQRVLRSAGIAAYAIHSNNHQSSTEVKQFVESEAPGVLIAVRKLRFGFDCRDLAWEIIARRPSQKTAEQDMEQMLGRVIRLHKDKIGLVLTFKDIYDRYLAPLIKAQTKKPRLSGDFLAHEAEYHVNKDGTCKMVDPDVEELKKENPSRFFASSERKRKHAEYNKDDHDMTIIKVLNC